MRVQQEVNENIEYIGEIKENKVGIDRANVDFITTLLTSNLYSKPLESFLRETISNAYDSHIEAGKPDTPIILMIKSTKNNYYGDSGKYDISVRDYGVGISPERFQKIYTNIGSSTKRESDDYIGGWGIGRFSALSCTDNVLINSYYNNVKYSYVMYKNGTGINIDKISEIPGDYKQGVEICIKDIYVKNNNLKEAISKLAFFDNLVIHGEVDDYIVKDCITRFNERKNKKFDNFYSCSLGFIPDGIYAKVGNVLYKVNANETYNLSDIFSNKYDVFLALDCPIGSVNVTPNREELQYTDKTRKKLYEVIAKTKEEIQKITKEKIQTNFNTLNEAYNFYVQGVNYPISDRINVNIRNIAGLADLIVKDSNVPSYVDKVLMEMRYHNIDESYIYGILDKKRFEHRPYRYVSKSSLSYESLLQYKVFVKEDDRMKQVTKEYYIDKYPNDPIIILYKSQLELMLRSIKRKIRNIIISHSDITTLKAISYILKHLDIVHIKNDNVPKEYIECYNSNTNTKKKRTQSSSIKLRTYNRNGYITTSLDSFNRYYLSRDNGLVVFSTHSNEGILRVLAKAFSNKIFFISVKKDNINDIYETKRFVKLENFLNLRNNYIAKRATVKYLRDKYGKYYNQITGLSFGTMRSKFKEYYNKYLYFDMPDVTILMNQYIEKKWLDWGAIQEFQLSNDDIKRLNRYQVLESLENLTDSLLELISGNYYRDDKLGIVPNKKTTLLLKKLLKK